MNELTVNTFTPNDPVTEDTSSFTSRTIYTFIFVILSKQIVLNTSCSLKKTTFQKIKECHLTSFVSG